ncbi:MAG TPA: O-antigen ligase family protein [Jatrophihabitans sp.]|nr:O-antigen ligase family protein [Jatrophihabitans sp.]
MVLDRWGAPLLLGAVSIAVLAQGAFYRPAQWYVAALLVSALLVIPGRIRLSRADRPIILAAAALAGWALIDATARQRPGEAIGYLVLLAGMAAVLIGCARLDAQARDLLLTGLLGCGVLVALLGWLGVAFHLARLSWQGQRLWRASSTLTYPNATAVILAMLVLVALALLAVTPHSLGLLLASTVLLTGELATLSRAGYLGVAVGVLVLVAVRGPRAVVRVGAAPVLGAAVAAAGLLPATTSPSAHPAVAVAGLLAGLVVGALPALRPIRGGSRLLTGLGLALLAGVSLAVGLTRLHTAIRAVSTARLTVEDSERAASYRAALRLFDQHPLWGVGPDLRTLTWTSNRGTSTYRYAHNEYLQVLAELGIVGGLLLAVLLVLTFRRLYQAQLSGTAISAGALAAAAALTVHAGFDFVWHIPAIPLLAAALVGLALPESPAGRATQSAGETPQEEYR